jgi:hypothetical protein
MRRSKRSGKIRERGNIVKRLNYCEVKITSLERGLEWPACG